MGIVDSAPPISPWMAATSCILFSTLFVGSLYVFPLPKLSPELMSRYKFQRIDRDHPLVIQQRIKGIALTMIVIPIYLWVVFSYSKVLDPDWTLQRRLGHFLHLLGLTLPADPIKILNHIFIPPFLVACLFLGPLFVMLLNKELPFQSQFHWKSHWREFTELIGIRNYIVGPIAEEYVFRSCMVAIVAYSDASIRTMVFVLPLVFGIAHMHHGYEKFVKMGRTRNAFIQVTIIVLVQLTYTSLFGWFATYLFLRTSSLVGPCLSHSLCNIMGLPDLSGIQLFGRWKIIVYLTFILGMILFGVLLKPLTDPSLYGDSTSSAYWNVAN